MPLEEMDDSSEDGSDEEVNEEESQEAAFVVSHTHKPRPHCQASCEEGREGRRERGGREGREGREGGREGGRKEKTTPMSQLVAGLVTPVLGSSVL